MTACFVPSCDGVVASDPHRDETGGLCDGCLQRERYAAQVADDLHLMTLDEHDGGDRFARAAFPPPALPAPIRPPDPSRWQDPDGSRYGLKALEGIMRELTTIPAGHPSSKGLGRNEAISRSAYRCGQLVGGGELREHVARVALRYVAQQLGLSRREYEPLIERRLNAGQQNPRSAPERRAA